MYATFRVINDVFYASITNPTGSTRPWPFGAVNRGEDPGWPAQCGNGTYNCGWSWRIDPAGITFAGITIEVCDATPEYVQGNCSELSQWAILPWSAELIALHDCRTTPGCPWFLANDRMRRRVTRGYPSDTPKGRNRAARKGVTPS